jgi:hypothetical protein
VQVQDEARSRILEASAWIQANPALADVPGVVPPSLDPMRIAVAKLRELARRYFVGLPPLVPMDVPATQPSWWNRVCSPTREEREGVCSDTMTPEAKAWWSWEANP